MAWLCLGPVSGANATEWSLQPTANPTPLNKSELEDVACPTTTMCMGVGNDYYLGKGFAQVWKNSEWKMVQTFKGQVKAVSCPTTTFCATIAKNENGAWRLKEFQFSPGQDLWLVSTDTPAIPAGATGARLLDISCTAENACTAVGRYEANPGEWKAHAERWNGSSWSPQTVPAPAGETRSPELAAVACTSATACTAVGTVELRPPGSTYRKVTMAARWNGSSWAVDSSPNPAGATSSGLEAVSCFSSSSCMALGTYTDANGTRPFSERLESGSWSLAATATPADAKGAVKLTSVSCTAATACVAVGRYVSATEGEGFLKKTTEEKTLVERWDGSQWSVQGSPNAAEQAFSSLAAVACSSQTVCTAVGKSRPAAAEQDMVTLGARWEGESWSLQSTANPTPLNKSELEDVSCPTTTMCMGVGNDYYLGKGFAQVWSNSEWKMVQTFKGQVKAVSCPTTTFCATVAKNENGAWRLKEFQFVPGQGTWLVSTDTPAIPASATGATLLDISCTAGSACTAVGRYQTEAGEWKAHAERWNGSSWSPQTVPAPAGETRSPELAGVSCTSATACAAVGTVELRPPGSTYRKVTMAARWDGSSWAVDTSPNPAGATSSGLEAVSCFSSSSCMALGTYTDANGTRPFSERLESGSWSLAPTVTPADAKGAVKLTSVSCTTATACVAVGRYVSATEGEGILKKPFEEKTLVERWDGSQWSVQGSPNAAEQAFSALAGVACSSQTVCTAVGKSRPAAAEQDMVTLGARWEEADSESPDTFITSGPEGLVTTADATFSFEATEVNATFECSMDEAAYKACASPSTYKALGQGAHLLRVRAVDAFGNQDASPAERAFEVDTEAPQTTIDSSTPTYTSHETLPPIDFSSSEQGSTLKCSFDSQQLSVCEAPYSLPGRIEPGWHTFTAVATDAAGNVDPTPAKWTFNPAIYPSAPASSKLVSPEEGKKTGSHYTLKAAWAAVQEGTVTGVSFQMKLSTWEAFKAVPAECVIDSKGASMSWPIPVGTGSEAGHTEPVFFDARDCAVVGTVEGQEIQFRAVFDGSGSAAGASEPVTTEFVRGRNAGRVPTDAVESVGPGTVDLVTGAFTISRTDVSIPVPGTEANLEFSRFYDSTVANSLPAYSAVMGGSWQPSAPTEAENPGEVWIAVEEQRIEATPAVYEKECWDEEGNTVGCDPAQVCDLAHNCEEWMVEEAQPEQRWIELIGTEGVTIPFEIDGTSYVAPEGAKELVLTRPSEGEFVLRDPNGTETVFVKESGQRYLPKTVSFQATPNSVRMVYELAGRYGNELRLEKIIGPAPAGVTCDAASSYKTAGCRALKLEYLETNHWTGGGWPSWSVNLASIRYYNGSGDSNTSQVVAQYNYNAEGRLIEVWDPRVSPALKEKYSYEVDTSGVETKRLKTLTPPGEEPWEFGYYLGRPGQPLKSVSRATLLSNPSTATTTIAYDVPVSGEDAPYDMSPSSVARWGQADFPVDATAVFPPTQVPDIDTFGFRSSFGSAGSGAGQLNEPRGSAIDPEGNIWVADTGNNRIVEFTPEGEYVSSFGTLGSGNGQLDHPRGLAFDPEGNIWVADTGNNRIQKFSPEGAYLAKAGAPGSGPGQFDEPSGITIRSSGSIWVSDTGNDRVQQLSSTGAYVATVTGLNGPTGMASRGIVVLVADTGNNRIAQITPGYPTPTGFIGSQGSGDGQMNQPEGIVSDGTGYYWVADTGNNRIQQLTSKGTFVDAYGSSGSDPGQFSAPAGLAMVDGTGNLFVADSGNNRIELWNSTTPPVEDYSQAAVHYMDPDGYKVNTAAAPPPGVEGSAITTSEVDSHGNVVRSLSAQNRLLALETGDSAARSKELDSHSVYSADGTELLESWGPLHEVRLESGETVEARQHTTVKYDEGAPALKEGESAPRLPTKEISGAAIPGQSSDADQRVSETRYDWTLRKPTESIVDPAGLNIRSVTAYDPATRQPSEMRQPSNPGGGGAGTTKMIYYSKAPNSAQPGCGEMAQYAGLPCKVLPAAQPGTAGQPQLLVKTFWAYNNLDQPTEIRESPGGGAENLRKTIKSYDAAGRPRTQKIEGGGQAVPTTETVYSSTSGRPVKQMFLCSISCTGFDSQATTTTYDALGRVKAYEDADGGKANRLYDLLGRPYWENVEKSGQWIGAQLVRYDEVSGLPVELETEAGTFTARYDADGKTVEQGLPNGLLATTSYNEAGESTDLTYTKASNCGESCTWLNFGLDRSVQGQILNENGTLGTDRYAYDKAGRLVSAEETPAGGSCTTRAYVYDVNSNRTSRTTRSPGLGGACSNSGGTTQNYSYDAADRLLATGLVYDSFGRITKLPGLLAGGGELTTSYFSTDMVASQSQDGVTNTFELDASLRQRARQQAGGLEGTEIFHYAGPSDSPVWTERGSAWTLNIGGLGGELGAVYESATDSTTLQLTNLHGDVVATASTDPAATSLKATFRSDEFGNPTSGNAGRYGWLGGKHRRTELPSGVIQMGVRSYVPAIGRFISTDPIRGGSANTYDYANQDPVNTLDLTGEAACKITQTSTKVKTSGRVRHRVKSRAFAQCTRAASHVRVKAVIREVAYRPAPGKAIDVGGQPGPSIDCGHGGPKFSCEMPAEKSFEAQPPCGVRWAAFAVIVYRVSWQTASGRRKTLMREEFFPFFIQGICK